VSTKESSSLREISALARARDGIVDESARCEARPESKPASSQPRDNFSTECTWSSMIDSNDDSREMRDIHRARTRDSFMFLTLTLVKEMAISTLGFRSEADHVALFRGFTSFSTSRRVICTSVRGRIEERKCRSLCQRVSE
jgi:hypothetical protein